MRAAAKPSPPPPLPPSQRAFPSAVSARPPAVSASASTLSANDHSNHSLRPFCSHGQLSGGAPAPPHSWNAKHARQVRGDATRECRAEYAHQVSICCTWSCMNQGACVNCTSLLSSAVWIFLVGNSPIDHHHIRTRALNTSISVYFRETVTVSFHLTSWASGIVGLCGLTVLTSETFKQTLHFRPELCVDPISPANLEHFKKL
jgi:hypothetical protein